MGTAQPARVDIRTLDISNLLGAKHALEKIGKLENGFSKDDLLKSMLDSHELSVRLHLEEGRAPEVGTYADRDNKLTLNTDILVFAFQKKTKSDEYFLAQDRYNGEILHIDLETKEVSKCVPA